MRTIDEMETGTKLYKCKNYTSPSLRSKDEILMQEKAHASREGRGVVNIGSRNHVMDVLYIGADGGYGGSRGSR